MEDTDQDRHQESAVKLILDQLKWLGLQWDEGPWPAGGNSLTDQGSFGPYRQSARLSLYKEKALELIEKGKAFYCFMTPEQEERQKAQAVKEGRAYRAFSPDRDQPLETARKRIEKGERACIRFKTPERGKNYELKDLLRGRLCFPPDSLGDFVLVRRDGFPVYNFSCAVDDGLMAVSHVLRGEEHLPNSLKQQLIQEALELASPKTAHLSLILGPDRKKLSKRSQAESLEHYKLEGFLPSALVNFLALLGWNPGTEQELFSLSELIQDFELNRLNIPPAVFDSAKLLWLNGQHIKRLEPEELFSKIKDFAGEELGDTARPDMIPHLRTGFKTLKQAVGLFHLFDDKKWKVQESAKAVSARPSAQAIFQKGIAFLRALPGERIEEKDFKRFQKQIQEEDGLRGKDFFVPIRSALLGQTEGLEIKSLIFLMPKAQMIQRLKKAML